MHSEEDDMSVALNLQLQFDQELDGKNVPDPPRGNLSVVDPYWELHDPTPNVQQLFVDFNEAFFWGKLGSVTVSWSQQMTLCAGTCSYQGGLCSIRLSEPLLRLRPRKDLVETLLHEMIHAFLFVTHNNKDRSSHGPEFHKHMKRINEASGANITVYHSFHNEVESYRIHAWRCDGPCRLRSPYYGVIKRAVNRAPAPTDFWWPAHQKSCGGTYHKVAGPEPGRGKRKGTRVTGATAAKSGRMDGGADIRTMFAAQSDGKAPAASAPASRNSEGPSVQGTGVSNSTVNLPDATGRLSAGGAVSQQPPTAQVVPFTGTGHRLGGNSSSSRLIESVKDPSSAQSGLASSSVSRTTSVQQGSPLPVAEIEWARTGARPKLPKPSCSVQKTLTDFEGQRPVPTKPVGRAGVAAKMKFIVELLSSDTESDDECTVLPAGGVLGTTKQHSTSSSQPSFSHAPTLVQCSVCDDFIEQQHFSAHLDACQDRGN